MFALFSGASFSDLVAYFYDAYNRNPFRVGSYSKLIYGKYPKNRNISRPKKCFKKWNSEKCRCILIGEAVTGPRGLNVQSMDLRLYTKLNYSLHKNNDSEKSSDVNMTLFCLSIYGSFLLALHGCTYSVNAFSSSSSALHSVASLAPLFI